MDGVTLSRTALPGDPKGSTHVRLNEASEFVGFHGLGQLYGASYNMAETNERHRATAALPGEDCDTAYHGEGFIPNGWSDGGELEVRIEEVLGSGDNTHEPAPHYE